MTRISESRGFALPVAMFALVLVGVIAVGSFYMTRQDSRVSVAGKHAGIALNLAEAGITEVLAAWQTDSFPNLPAWTPVTAVDTTPEGNWAVDITRITDRLYFLQSTSEVSLGGAVLSGATRTLGMMVRISTPQLDPPAALMTRGAINVAGGALIQGNDRTPPGWDDVCDDPGDAKPGILTDDTTGVNLIGGGEIEGDPPTEQDSSISDSTFTSFGDFDWDDLVSLANIRVAGGSFGRIGPDSTVSGGCDTTSRLNWGNPANPAGACGSYFPMIYVAGNATMQGGGFGQGILLVEGDLSLRGNFFFSGIIIVQGRFQTQGSGNRILGGVMANNAMLLDQSLVGGSIVSYSSCAAEQSVLNNLNLTRPRPLQTRSWVDLSSAEVG